MKYWKEANGIYEETRDFTLFKNRLADKWNLNLQALDDHADLIWTVLNLYPHGRNVMRTRAGKVREVADVESSPKETGVIKLRGFRKVF